jgi:MYXO-CTERM domain-containing protein
MRLTRFSGLIAVVLYFGAAAFATAHAAIIPFGSSLQAEAAGATGSGSVLVQYDDVEHTLQIFANWSGLTGTTTVAHIHCCTSVPETGTVGVAVTPVTLPGFPVGVTAGTYVSPLIDLDLAGSFTSTFLTGFGGGTVSGGLSALLAGMDAGTAYFNIHSTAFPGGEIRGFLQRVPEPASWTLALVGVLALAGARRRRVQPVLGCQSRSLSSTM